MKFLFSLIVFASASAFAFNCQWVADEIAKKIPTRKFLAGESQVYLYQPSGAYHADGLKIIERTISTAFKTIFAPFEKPPILTVITSKGQGEFLGGLSSMEISDRICGYNGLLFNRTLKPAELVSATAHELGHVLYQEQVAREVFNANGGRKGIDDMSILRERLKAHRFESQSTFDTIPIKPLQQNEVVKELQNSMAYQELFADLAAYLITGQANTIARMTQNAERRFNVQGATYESVVKTYSKPGIYNVFYPTRLYLEKTFLKKGQLTPEQKAKLLHFIFKSMNKEHNFVTNEITDTDLSAILQKTNQSPIEYINRRLVAELEQFPGF